MMFTVTSASDDVRPRWPRPPGWRCRPRRWLSTHARRQSGTAVRWRACPGMQLCHQRAASYRRPERPGIWSTSPAACAPRCPDADPAHRAGHSGLSIELPLRRRRTGPRSPRASISFSHDHRDEDRPRRRRCRRRPDLPALTQYARCMRGHDIAMLDPAPTASSTSAMCRDHQRLRPVRPAVPGGRLSLPPPAARRRARQRDGSVKRRHTLGRRCSYRRRPWPAWSSPVALTGGAAAACRLRPDPAHDRRRSCGPTWLTTVLTGGTLGYAPCPPGDQPARRDLYQLPASGDDHRAGQAAVPGRQRAVVLMRGRRPRGDRLRRHDRWSRHRRTAGQPDRPR